MTPRSDAHQISLLPPEAGEILHLVRENLRLLSELTTRYEIGHVDTSTDGRSVRDPADVAAYLGAEFSDLAQEQLRVVLLDTRNRVIASQLVYQGGINATVIRLADCFREAVARGAAGVIFAHNHPSGDPTPSAADIHLTAEAGRVGDLLGIHLLDHIVVARQGHVSLRQRGLYVPPGTDKRGPNASAGDSPNA